MGLFSGGNSSQSAQQYTGTTSGSGLTVQGKSGAVNTGTNTNVKSNSNTKDVGNVTIKADKGATVTYTPIYSNPTDQQGGQNSILEKLASMFSSGSGGGGGGGITVNATPPASTAATLATSSVVKYIVVAVVILGIVFVWKIASKKS